VARLLVPADKLIEAGLASFPALCRFSAAGSADLTTRSDDRRLKSAKARNRSDE
jgi:hypothetical protein